MAKADGQGMADKIKTNVLSQGNNSNESTATEKVKLKDMNIKQLIELKKESIGDALPSHLDLDRFKKIILIAISQNRRLLECTPISILTAVLQSAQLGLEPGVLGQCYLIPYFNKTLKKLQVQFQISYKGLIELCRRSGNLKKISASEVYENDEFVFEYGTNERLYHVPELGEDRGKIIGFYAVAKLSNGENQMVVLARSEVDRIRDDYSKAHAKGSSPWKTEYAEMGKKTAVKRLVKFLPVSAEILRRVAGMDETVKQEISARMEDIPSAETTGVVTRPDEEEKKTEKPKADDKGDIADKGFGDQNEQGEPEKEADLDIF